MKKVFLILLLTFIISNSFSKTLNFEAYMYASLGSSFTNWKKCSGEVNITENNIQFRINSSNINFTLYGKVIEKTPKRGGYYYLCRDGKNNKFTLVSRPYDEGKELFQLNYNYDISNDIYKSAIQSIGTVFLTKEEEENKRKIAEAKAQKELNEKMKLAEFQQQNETIIKGNDSIDYIDQLNKNIYLYFLRDFGRFNELSEKVNMSRSVKTSISLEYKYDAPNEKWNLSCQVDSGNPKGCYIAERLRSLDIGPYSIDDKHVNTIIEFDSIRINLNKGIYKVKARRNKIEYLTENLNSFILKNEEEILKLNLEKGEYYIGYEIGDINNVLINRFFIRKSIEELPSEYSYEYKDKLNVYQLLDN